jgi:hypothetical protein
MIWDFTFAVLCSWFGWMACTIHQNGRQNGRQVRDYQRVCKFNQELQMRLLEEIEVTNNLRAELARSKSQSLAE